MNETPNKIKKIIKCLVCEDLGTGMHYGVSTCESCKV